MATIPRRPGVYQITCMPTGQVYIGRTVNLLTRWKAHTRLLGLGRHGNHRLQEAWNMFEPEDFRFSILEFADEADLVTTEQKWIDQSGCTDKSIGFNIADNAEYPFGIREQVWEGFVDPSGHHVTITNLHKFCRENNLDFPSMHRLSKGISKLKSYKGWTHRNSVRERDYIKTHEGFIDPAGNPVGSIVNMAEFCRQHDLDNTHMIALANGRILSHKGWTHVTSRQSLKTPKTYRGFINPAGERVIVTNFREFCEEHNLQKVKMYEVMAGKRPHHKDWTWREESDDTPTE